MKRFENKVLYISSEKTLEDLGKLLTEKDFKLNKICFSFMGDNLYHYLQFDSFEKDWFLGQKSPIDTELTKEEFINLLSQK